MKILSIFNIRNLINRHKPKNKVKITNLTNELKKVHYNGCEFDKLFRDYPHLSRTVGALPQKWGRKIGKSKEKRDAIDKLFSDFAALFHSCCNPKENLSINDLQKGLSEILEEPVVVVPIGEGSWGRTYKISVDSQDYVLKVFFEGSPEVYGSSKHCYGNFNELASAIYTSKHCADHFAMFYMGKFGEKQDGYLLTRFLREQECNVKMFNGLPENSRFNFVFSKYLRRIICWDDSDSNIIAKKVVDFGNCYNSAASDSLEPDVYKLAKRLGRCLDTNNMKEIDEILSEYQGSTVLSIACSHLQKLIEQRCQLSNVKILEGKSKLLDKLGLKIVTVESRCSAFRNGLLTLYDLPNKQ